MQSCPTEFRLRLVCNSNTSLSLNNSNILSSSGGGYYRDFTPTELDTNSRDAKSKYDTQTYRRETCQEKSKIGQIEKDHQHPRPNKTLRWFLIKFSSIE